MRGRASRRGGLNSRRVCSGMLFFVLKCEQVSFDTTWSVLTYDRSLLTRDDNSQPQAAPTGRNSHKSTLSSGSLWMCNRFLLSTLSGGSDLSWFSPPHSMLELAVRNLSTQSNKYTSSAQGPGGLVIVRARVCHVFSSIPFYWLLTDHYPFTGY